MSASPASSTRVRVDGHEVVTCSYGDSHQEVLFLLNGGPGLPCDYLREPMLCMVEAGYRVVTYDQLGCGKSDRPNDPKLWTIARYVREALPAATHFEVDSGHVPQLERPRETHRAMVEFLTDGRVSG